VRAHPSDDAFVLPHRYRHAHNLLSS
jgi:hypothetical protein